MALILFAGLCAADSAKAASYVNPNQVYSYERMTYDMKVLARKYPSIVQYRSLGKTPYGREIWAIKLGKGDATVFYNSSHHAREWLTTNLVMEMIDQYSEAYMAKRTFEGYNVQSVLNNTSIWFVPMVNPDGVTLQQKGLNAFPKSIHSKLIKMNNGSRNFKRWKANAQGIDLNRQYPANWDSLSRNSSVKSPSFKNFSGYRPLQAVEAQKIAQFTAFVDPEITISYHTSGRILYWHFKNKPQFIDRDRRIAEAYGRMSRYTLVKPSSNPSGGGYKDWFIQTYNRPGLTPELSYGVYETNPPISVFNEEWKRNRKAALYVAAEGDKLWEAKVSDANYNITTFEKVPLYDRPNTSHKTKLTLNPAYVKVTGTYKDYLRIGTTYGPKWIKKGYYINGTYKKISMPILLTEKTQLHSMPFTAKAGTYINPQTVKAVKSYNGWYAIQTVNGEKWIKPVNAVLNFNPVEANEQAVITTAVDWYDYPHTTKKRAVQLQPQTVTVKQVWGTWRYVTAAEGEGWIK
ncbi:hypothetical protein CGZ90_13810 [Fictibacillus aquaticus]|uniref:Peptidase M14 domain-containing protein n=2 Tax=Fictibacillus aquaticus TaxID=2021314 RepID=A0A235F8Q1_9BACL|nr:hypothetical protein CGZ90_13810 [Fictibacillus aquaticus]